MLQFSITQGKISGKFKISSDSIYYNVRLGMAAILPFEKQMKSKVWLIYLKIKRLFRFQVDAFSSWKNYTFV